MKRLFCVRNKHGVMVDNPATGQPWFDNKQEAKALRDSLGEKGPYTVSRGPDHVGKHSGYRVPYMRRQPRGQRARS